MGWSHENSPLLTAYDEELRGAVEMRGAITVDSDGPLFRGIFPGRRGFVSYRSLQDVSGAALDELIARTIAHYRDETDVEAFEWKTRGHDAPGDLADRLRAHGFEPEELETVMIGTAEQLAEQRPLPEGIAIRRIAIDDRDKAIEDVGRMLDMQMVVFGRPGHDDAASFVQALIDDPEHREAWIAEADGEIVCTGRLELVPGTTFAGLWGGATREDWRLHGVYRALTAARAQSAVAKGVRHLQSDSTEYSRPILDRSGFIAVTTTTPYVWERSPK